MAPPRQRKSSTETPYQRRIRRYLEAHPGATRQEARGHRLPAGVRSEYQKRTAGLEGEAKRAASGHRARADLERRLRDGDLVSFDPERSVRDDRGRWVVVEVIVLGMDGVERRYRLRRPSEATIRRLLRDMDRVGAISSPNYPLNRLLPETEAEEAEAA